MQWFAWILLWLALLQRSHRGGGQMKRKHSAALRYVVHDSFFGGPSKKARRLAWLYSRGESCTEIINSAIADVADMIAIDGNPNKRCPVLCSLSRVHHNKSEFYEDEHRAAFNDIQHLIAEDWAQLQAEGFCVGNSRVYPIILGMKGDWSYLVEAGNLNRSYRRGPRGPGEETYHNSKKEKPGPAGVCHLCLAGQNGHDWENMQAGAKMIDDAYKRDLPASAAKAINEYDWTKVEKLFSDLFSRRGGDRLPEAHALLGECRYRAARDTGATSADYASALEAFETALCFMTEETSGPREDPVLQLRVGRILHLKSEEENFSDAALAERAVKHYKKSAMVAPTAEAWKNIGLCRYRQVKLQATASRKEKKLQEAMKYFQEANVLDRERPDILAWLTICAVELGQVQVAKQGFRQLMQFEERLETPVALELAELLLRFSNEQRAADWGGERGRLVQDGRYSKEAAMLSKVILGRGEDGRTRGILAWCKFLDGDHGAAAGEFCASMTAAEDPEFLEEAAYMARHCASMIPGEPQLAALVEEAIAVACEQQQVPEDDSGLGLDEAEEENPETMETPRPEDLP